LTRSFVDSKKLAFVASVAVTSAGLGCSRVPGELEPLPEAWNADDISKGRCVGTCTPDYGPAPLTPADCARVEAGLEFFPVPVWDWEPGEYGTGQRVYNADDAYTYQDGTTEFLSTNFQSCTVEEHAEDDEEANCQGEYAPTPTPIDRCGSTGAMHLRGGPFREWGGGLGIRLDNVARAAAEIVGSSCEAVPLENPDPSEPAFCPEFASRIATASGTDYVQDDGTVYHRAMDQDGYYAMQVDLREWEGISFWARRGPDSQAGFRVVLGDLNLDDDASFLETQGGLEPTCRRAKECDCRNHRTCTYWEAGTGADEFGIERTWQPGWYCAEPALDLTPNSQWHPWNHELYRCDVTACDYRYPAYPNSPDAPFVTAENATYPGTATCNTFTFKNDITRKACFDAKNGPVPPESSERCGDPWIAPVSLGTDWEFYRIPFSELRQEGYGMEFPAIKLSAITMVRFTWHVGWADFWIDDVRFYRRQR
jgi:hypothetical protein